MERNLRTEDLLTRLKNILSEQDIKLWLPPYYEEEQSNIDSLQKLSSEYYRTLNIDQESCLELLQELQNTSVCRLEERRNFRAQGLATLRIRPSTKQTPEFSVQIKLGEIANDLRELVATKIQVPGQRLKLICTGRVLVPERTLDAQNVKNGCTILAVILPSEEEKHALAESHNNQMLTNETKSDVECLFGENEDKYFHVTNQRGASLYLPLDEKKALAVAMALHQKGKKAFRIGEFSSALVFFLEADTEFKYCRSELLEQVDNYALLNLDIVWTYLHLESLSCLKDAEKRLQLCEQGFIRTWGPNMERLQSINGSYGTESVLLVRLRLLQGILCYLTNRRDDAVAKFNDVENYIQILKVDNESIKALCDLGYSASEAKLALRNTFNDLNAAVEHINQRREEKKRIEEHERLLIFADRHKCLNGTLVNLTVLEQLHAMGYSRLFGVFALVNSNNLVNEALVWIENFFNALYATYPPLVVDRLKTLEFDESDVQHTLKKHNHELNDSCVLELLTLVDDEGELPMVVDEERTTDLSSDSTSNLSAEEPSTSSATSTATTSKRTPTGNSSKRRAKAKKKKMEQEALDRLHESTVNYKEEDDYLDSDLQSEEKFLLHYRSLLPLR